MVELRYAGKAPNSRIWKGPVTGTRYRFGPGVTRFVDKRDAAVFLNPQGDGGTVFERDSSQSD